ncbi:hypothetical protein KI387_027526 [Taxus chinensis]|uniref:Uncharacterized protein n=1 Tax=Taxus chinensis TaxID=29808 RepID=A0AA38FYH4_TAXCH|nr:hypothetical protein KI387_027526 [Taxus chinensis]
MSQMSMVDNKTNMVNSQPHQVERGTLGALGHSEDGVFRRPWRYTLPLWSMSMQRCASWISSGTLVLSDSGLGETFEVATSLEEKFMWETTKRRDGVRLGSRGRNGGETGVSKSRHGDVSGHGIGARSKVQLSRGKKSTSPVCDAVYKDGELAVLPAGIFGVVDLGDRAVSRLG